MELIYQLFVTPSLGMRRASEGNKSPLICLVVVLAILSNRIGVLLMLPETGATAKLALSMGLIIDLIVVFGTLFFLTAIFHLVAEIGGGTGKGASLYSVFSLALIPFWLITPLAITLKSWGKGGFFLFLTLWVILLGWAITLLVIGIREVYHFSLGKSAAIFIVPLAGISIALIILFLFFLVNLFLNVTDIFQFFPLTMNY